MRLPLRHRGRPRIVEDYLLPEGFDSSGVTGLNTNTLWMRLDALDRDFELSWVTARKQHGGGEVEACGGIFLVRVAEYLDVGGFDRRLLTQEERDLCRRLRQAGRLVIRLDRPMARHDSAMLTFWSWWRRALWGGHGTGIEMETHWDGRQHVLWLARYVILPKLFR